MFIFFIERRKCLSSLYRGGRLLLSRGETVYLFYRAKEARAPLLYIKEAGSYPVEKRERDCIFSIEVQNLTIFCIAKGADSFAAGVRESLYSQ